MVHYANDRNRDNRSQNANDQPLEFMDSLIIYGGIALAIGVFTAITYLWYTPPEKPAKSKPKVEAINHTHVIELDDIKAD